MNYTFIDGSGNKYLLQDGILKYSPMTPELSSSGTYSGGDPFTIDLDKKSLISIIDVFERALWSEADHVEKRTMGSGTLFKRSSGESQLIYLSFRSNSMTEIDKILSVFK